MKSVNKTKKLALALLLFGMLVLTATAQQSQAQAQIWTTDSAGNPVTDYAPTDTVYIWGTGFNTGTVITVGVVGPDGWLGDGTDVEIFDSENAPYASWELVGSDGFKITYDKGWCSGTFYVHVQDEDEHWADTTFTDSDNYNTSITLTAITTPLTAGQTGVSFSGKVSVTSPDPEVPDGAPVNLECRLVSTGPYVTLANTTTTTVGGNHGVFSGTFTAPAAENYLFRAVFPAHTVGSPPNAQVWKSSASADSGHGQTIVVNAAGPTNADPTLNVNTDPIVVNEGDEATNSGTVIDADGDTVGLTASVGTVINNDDGTWSWSFLTTDGPAESQTVTIWADDGNGGTSSVNFVLTVNNVAPSVGAIAIDLPVVAVNTEITASASFTDPGTLDTHTAVWDWGDLSTSAGTVAETNGSGTVSGSHIYSGAGIYTVTLTVTDKDGGSNTSIYEYVVVYDPSAGFVTGGGWIWSPAGAYTEDLTLEGKANFGFVAKYKKGANVPDGNTEFQFKAGDLNFHSTWYQWLVVAGAKATFKGEGTINGMGNYGFMLSAIDGTLDKFRIKIWNKTDDLVVYDNLVGGGGDAADPTTALGGGSIIVHTGKEK